MNPSSGLGMTSLRARQRLIKRLQQMGVSDPRVLEVIRDTPRHLFLDEALASRAYEDTALPIGLGQTLSQPFVVARMTEVLLRDGVPDKVLEIGTGSGYQTAVLAQLVPQVYSVERISRLLERAREQLRDLGLHNVRLKYADGHHGWPRYAPFDAIIVTAAAAHVPPELLQQLAVGGRLVAPVGPAYSQQLEVYERRASGMHHYSLGGVSFVPLLEGLE